MIVKNPNPLPDFNVARGPGISPPPDAGILRSLVEQQALKDAASDAYDEALLKSHENALPSERHIEAQIDRLIAENAVNKYDAGKVTIRAGFENEYNSSTNVAALDHEYEELIDMIDEAKAHRADEVAVLKGEAALPDGAKYIGHVPPRPFLSDEERASTNRARRALAFRPTRIARAMVDLGATFAFIPIEAWVISGPVKILVHTDNALDGLALSTAAVLVATFVPHFVGQTLSRLTKQAKFTVKKAIPLFFGTFWIAIALMLANVRTEAAANTYRDLAASTAQIAPVAVNMSQFDFWGQFAFWFLATLGAGIVIVLIKLVAYNPALSAVVKADNVIALRQVKLNGVVGERGRVEAQSKAQEAMDDITADQFDHFEKKVLPALRPELIALYRTTFINALTNPGITGPLALNEKSGRVSPVRPAAVADNEAQEHDQNESDKDAA